MNSYNAVEFWKTQPTDNPATVNGFRGTWKFSDHSLIPDTFNNFLLEYFYQYPKINKIPLEKINEVMNQVWEGPGSMVKIAQLTEELRLKRTVERPLGTKAILDDNVRTIDDEDEEFELNLDSDEDSDEEDS